MYKSIPTYENGNWSDTIFLTEQEFVDFLLSIFKIPGEYNFDETAFVFNAEATKFNSQGYYCNAPYRSKDFTKYCYSTNQETGYLYTSISCKRI